MRAASARSFAPSNRWATSRRSTAYCRSPPPVPTHNVAATTTPFPNTKTLWHYRAGHVNPAAMDAACGLVEGMEYSGRTIADRMACMEGKLHALPHPEAAEHRAQRPLQLIHSDICGPMTPSAMDSAISSHLSTTARATWWSVSYATS